MIAVFTSLIQSFPQAVIAGLLVASVCALLGVFVILKRIVFIGITLSEVAACGVALAMLMRVPPFAGGVVLTLAAVALLAYPFENRRIPRDAVLGILFVLASSLSVLLVSQSGFGLQEIKALLYGDLILTSHADLCVIGAVFLPALLYFLLFMRPTLYAFLDREAAYVLGVRPALWEMLFFMVLGVTIAAASKIAGTLLVFCYLIVPPTFALLLSRRLWLVMILAIMAAIAATVIGLYTSFTA
ncbi:MAG: metal ABC transporter permease, partial [Verrucomicrobiota bacterium]